MADEPEKQSQKGQNFGLCISMGAGIGVVLGAVFDNVGLGISLGAGIGCLWSRLHALED
ncbi:MAG: hypothetical protein VCF24_04455 [Candidatus Latescibacterota bacterium]